MFEIGDRIFYPMHGAGEIVNIEKREILGEELEYYVMFIPVGSIRVMVPVKNASNIGLRELASREEVDQAFAILADEKTKMPQNWNRRFRLNLDKIKGGDIFEIAAVIRNLILRDREKTLSTGERKMLNTAKQMLISEVVLVLDKEEEEVERLVQETVGE
ncbi:MAG: CarD family transcriptional regulator [Tissierellales bacterium]|jgi:CarD family transcriptional regulator|nr:CarD family transcriptional regulator [Tissierellales bacterium]